MTKNGEIQNGNVQDTWTVTAAHNNIALKTHTNVITLFQNKKVPSPS